MKCIKIELLPDEEKIFEYRLYQFQGMQIAIDQFLTTNVFSYNEEHYNRLTDTYIEKYRLFTENILKLLEDKQYKDIAVQNFNYEYSKGILTIHFQ